MVVEHINGLDIDFPYPPYPSQKRYVSAVITALRNKHNALLESPTGTGKTLCLLLATLAWRSVYTAALQSITHKEDSELLSKAGLQRSENGGATSALEFLKPGGGGAYAVPKIIYCSRTHTQLAQVVGELKKTIYRPFMTVLGSRDQMCVHDIASNFSGARLSSMCRRLTNPKKRECKYYLSVMSSRQYENRSESLLENMSSTGVMDIEDLKAFGRDNCACPWYLSRLAAQNGAIEILFLPYNYLLDRATRSTLDIDWSHDVVIIDEAHNLESVCVDAMSFDLTTSLREGCDAELAKLIEGGLRPGGIVIPALENLAAQGAVDSVIGSENRDLLEIKLLRSILTSMNRFVEDANLDRGDKGVTFRVFAGDRIRKLFKDCDGPTLETYTLFLESIDRAMGIQADQTSRTETTTSRSALVILQTAIRVLFDSVSAGGEDAFRTVIHSNQSGQRTLSYWCFKPSVAMRSITQLKFRCLLLTSGTLSPMDSFASELGLPFPIRLENGHVITRSQIWAGVIKQGPDWDGARGCRLTSSFYARGQATNVQLGRALLKVAAVVPDGLLVFFPSYNSLFACVQTWKEVGPGANLSKPSIWESLQSVKRIVTEQRESSQFAATILAHRANVDDRKGSILLAVCRGKVSEGIDFSDEYGRAVVITGLPYPSAYDPRVVLKREFADEEVMKLQRRGQKKDILSGAEWYTTQALRAVNQAVGRAIRHRYDYGAIVLCEERFQSVALQNQISKWIRPNLSVCSTFAAGENSLSTFFHDASLAEFAKAAQQQKAKMDARIGSVSRKKGEDSTAVVFAAQKAITKFVPPCQTEEQTLEKFQKLTEELSKGTKRKAESSLESTPKKGFLDYSESARGGLFDSGSSRLVISPPKSDVPKRSALFLQARSKREDEPPTIAVRKLSRPVKKGAGPMKLSERIRQSFPVRKELEEFLGFFRSVMSAHGNLKDGKGPLLSGKMARNEAERGRKAITDVINFTKSKLTGNDAQDLLKTVRSKIPKEFLAHYDEICTYAHDKKRTN